MSLLKRVKYMLLVAVFGVIAIWVACSDSPPVAPEPASKVAQAETDSTASGAATDTSQVVQFADANLRRAIEQTLRKPPAAQLTTADMDSLTRLYAEEKGIVSLVGLEQATSLDTLSLWGNKIVDVSPLAGLTNLRFLNLGNNQIADASPLASLPNLGWLSLWGNEVEDVSALEGLKTLTSLNLWGNDLEDASALAGLTKLRWLNVGNTQIADASPLDSLKNLEWLGLLGSRVRAYELPKQISALTEEGVAIDIFEPAEDTDSGIRFGDPIVASKVREALSKSEGPLRRSDLERLDRLDLSEQSVKSLEGLEYATALQELVLTNSGVTDVMLASLAGLVSLQKLTLSGNGGVTDAGLSALAGLTNLQELYLDNTGVTSLSALPNLPSLHTLDLENTRVANAAPLGSRTSLLTLDLDNTMITDVTPLGSLTSLLTLDLDNTDVADVGPLRSLASLETLNLNNTMVVDVEPLLSLASLKMLDLRRITTFNSASISTHIPALEAKEGLTVLNDGPWVTFADANLERVMRAKLQIPTNPITVSAVMALTGELRATEQNIVDLAGLEHATGLMTLRLSGNGQLADLSALSRLTNLRLLSLDGTGVMDANLASLRRLTDLRELYLDGATITNTAVTASLGSLTGLQRLSLTGTGVTDLSALSSLSNLRWLRLNNTGVVSLSPLTGLSNLQTLLLEGVTTLDAASVNTHIPALVARNVMVTSDLVTFPDANLRRAVRVALGKSQDIFYKSELPTITSINVPDQGIADLTGLEFATGLQELYLESNAQLVNVSALSGLTKLTMLSLNGTGVTDVSALRLLTKLETLNLMGTGVTDVSALKALNALQLLNLSNTMVVDLELLVGLGAAALETLNLLGVTTLSDASKNTHISTLRARGVTVLHDAGSVTFADNTLEGKVRAALSKPSGTITPADMAGLRRLDTNEDDVTSLSGLEYATGLEELDLGFSAITNAMLVSLAGLTSLKKLDLLANNLGDAGIARLSGLTNMEELRLGAMSGIGNNGVASLSRMTKLKKVRLDGTSVGNPAMVTLSKLTKLTHIDLADAGGVTDVSPLVALPDLEELDLSGIANRQNDASNTAIQTLKDRGVRVSGT